MVVYSNGERVANTTRGVSHENFGGRLQSHSREIHPTLGIRDFVVGLAVGCLIGFEQSN